MKGMRKVKRGRGFRGVLNYVFGRDEDHKNEPGRLLGGNLSGTDSRTLAQEFGMTRTLRPEIEKPVWHNSLRLPKGESISDDKWVEIADDYMSRIGFTDLNLRCYVLHDDDEGQHIHIVASRIALDGSLYLGKNENLESTRIIQELETDHLLTITKGPEYVDGKIKMPDIKAPKKGEIEGGIRKGVRPPKLVLQDLLSEAIKTPKPVMDFVRFLEDNGVGVIPNLPSTRRLNGFSFTYDGLSFKGSSLGNQFKWSQLQEAGITYEQDRDFEELAKRKPVVRNDSGNAGSIGSTTTSDSQPNDGKFGADGKDGQVAGSGAGYPESDHGAIDTSRRGRDPERDADTFAGQSEAVGDDGTGTAPKKHADKQKNAGMDTGDQKFAGREVRNAEADHPVETPILDSSRISGDTGSGSDRDDDGIVTVTAPENVQNVPDSVAWNSRFKKASAKRAKRAKRREKEQKQDSPDRRVDYTGLRDAAHMADLVDYMKSVGLEVKKDGVKDWVVDDLYRVTKKPDGHYVWCTWDQSRGGDAIAFCIDELGLTFQQALADLSGSTITKQETKRYVMSHDDKSLISPPQSKNYDTIYAYLESRGISQKTARHAYARGFLKFVDYAGVAAAAFCGLGDNGKLRSMTVRLTQPIQSFDGEKPITKIDVRHSDKSFPAIWRGDDQSAVWVVEGGMDALAIVEWHKAKKQEVPTIIVSGGAGVRSFLDQPHVQKILKNADTVYVAMEHEKDPETQAKTDAAHEKQIDKLCDLGCERVIAWMPPKGTKDIADAWKAGTLPDPHENPQEVVFAMGDEDIVSAFSPRIPSGDHSNG